jgi:hypothetical protein
MLTVTPESTQTVLVNEPFTYEIHGADASSLGVITLFLEFDPSRFSILDINSNLDDIKYSIRDGLVAIAWSDVHPVMLKQHETLFSFTVKAKKEISEPEMVFSLKPGCEVADQSAYPFPGFGFNMPQVKTAGELRDLTLSSYPNPFKQNSTIQYSLPQAGHVKLTLSNMVGETVALLTDADMNTGNHSLILEPDALNMKPGVYFVEIRYENPNQSMRKVKKLVFTK